jgi:uncharacterized protein
MRAKKTLLYSLFAIIICLGIYGFFIEPYDIEVHHLWINDGKFGAALKGMTVIHISDLHMGRPGAREKEVLNVIKDIKPDIIFLTGDYVKWDGDYESSLNYLSQLKARVGVWAVMGDYDYSNSRKSCLFCHMEGTGNPTKRYNVHFLRNLYEQVKLPGGDLCLYGVDIEEMEYFNKNAIKGKTPCIVLSHNPMAFDKVDNDSNILMLAGDTHGGQIPLPSWFWRLIGYEKNAKYNHGLYRQGKKMMYVSKGIGTSHIPFRFLERPEIVVIHF